MYSDEINFKNPQISATHNADYVYVNNEEISMHVLSRFYDHIAKYYDITDMMVGKEFIIKSFIND